jgi:catechol 2,3-dioxygenase-like lactoylglutathione lyase family enzyme
MAMPLTRLDHVNLKTARLAELEAFYCGVLGLRRGPRPPFANTGAWLYCGDQAVVHLVETSQTSEPQQPPHATDEPRLSHFAFTATGLGELLERLQAAGVPCRRGVAAGSGGQQVNLRDPDGNALHIDFAADEAG